MCDYGDARKIDMAKTFERPTHSPQHVPVAPEPSSASASDGMDQGRETARRYLLDAVLLWAGVAFAPDSEASPWTRVQCARLIAEVAGAIPQAVPAAPRPRDDPS
jgi:hypothetical protein